MQLVKRGNQYRVECLSYEKVNGHCPSVDVLFDSVAEKVGTSAKGLLKMKQKGAFTIEEESMKTLLAVEDDEAIALGIQKFLEKNKFNVIHVDTVESAKSTLINQNEVDLILLDLNLPDGSGYDFCKFVKERKDIPIIFLTVCDEESQIVKGLDMGADDYITKPFALSVLLSRVNAVLRRNKKNNLWCDNVKLDKDKKCAYLKNEKIYLSASEYKLLCILFENKNHTLTRGMLLEKLWDAQGNFVNDNTLTVTMKRLREKLQQPKFIKTIRGIGYLVEDIDE